MTKLFGKHLCISSIFDRAYEKYSKEIEAESTCIVVWHAIG